MVQDDPTLGSLSDRLRKLEQENRALKRWGVAGFLVVGAFVAMGAAQNNQKLSAQKLVITDASGNSRAVLTGTPTGALLGFINAAGDLGASLEVDGKDSTLSLGGLMASKMAKGSRLVLDSSDSGASLRMTEADEKTVRLILEPEGPRLSLHDSSEGVDLAIRKDGPSLLMSNSSGSGARVGIFSGTPSLRLIGPGGGLSPSAGLTILESGPALTLNGDENISAGLRASKDGPSLEIEDAQGYEATVGSTGLVTPRTGESHATSAASVTLFDKQKNVIWKAP